ncbi:MAG: ATP-binding protein [Candidatus Limnocylindria bacterium]
MTAELLPNSRASVEHFGGEPAERFLDGLAALYPFVLLSDLSGHVRWMSQEFHLLCGDAEPHVGRNLGALMSRVTKREQALALRGELQERGWLAGARLEITGRDGAPLSLELSVLPLSDRPDEAGLLAVIARPELPREPIDSSLLRGAGFEGALLAGSPDPVLLVDANGILRYANRAVEALLGCTPAELIGRPVAVLCSGARDLDAMLSTPDAGDDAIALDLMLRRRDGSKRAVSAVSAPAPTEAGFPGGLLLTLRDDTRARSALAEVQRKNADLENCVNTLAHDLRSPLVALLGFSRLLRQDYGARLDDTGLHFVDRIEQAGRTMESLIHDLLELSRIGQPGERRSMVDPRAVLQQLHAELKPRLDAGGIELRLPAHPPLVYCDRTRLYQVFSNLIGNAIDHMGPCANPCIDVNVVEEADCEHITVRDRGRGIAPEHLDRIFEVFQSFGRHNDEHRGTGIGLAIVKKIAQTHGGRVWVESRPGAGSTFHVTLPRR